MGGKSPAGYNLDLETLVKDRDLLPKADHAALLVSDTRSNTRTHAHAHAHAHTHTHTHRP